jgi:hypothetical protein
MYVYNNVVKRLGQTYMASLKEKGRTKGGNVKTGDFW